MPESQRNSQSESALATGAALVGKQREDDHEADCETKNIDAHCREGD